MIQKEAIQNYIINFILSVLLCFSFLYALTTSLSFTYGAFSMILSIALFILLYSIIFLNRLSLLSSGIILGIFILFCTVYLLKTGIFFDFINGITRLVSWLPDYISGNEYLNEKYAMYVTLFLCALVSLPIYFFTFKQFNFYILLASGAGIFVSQWILDYFVSYEAFYIFLFLIVIYYFKHVYNYKTKHETSDYAAASIFTVWLAPVSAVIIFFSFLIPGSDKPLEWKWLDNKITAVNEYFNTNYKYQAFDIFSVSTAGFGESNGKLGGKARLDDTLVLSVTTPHMTYLKGAVSTIYDGSKWTNSDFNRKPVNDTNNMQKFDLWETEIGMQLLSNKAGTLEDYFQKDNIDITFENLKTKSLFIPIKTDTISFPEEKGFQYSTDSNGSIFSDKTMGKSYKYTISSYSINYNDEEFKSIVRKSKKDFYNDILNQLRSPINRGRSMFLRGAKFSLNDIALLSVNAGEIYAKYLQLPSSLPKRVKALAAEISIQANNNYDKVRSIEQYLSKNYPYTLNTKITPKGRDFVDYFLFDQKHGYCTYYASSMVALVRCIGIPARYVEGYVLPSSPESGTTYRVTNQQAHAWAEVYFEGFGWIPFEPTSPSVSAFYSNKNETGVFTQEFLDDPSMQDYITDLAEYGDTAAGIDTSPVETKGWLPSNEVITWSAFALILLILFILISFNFIKNNFLLFKSARMQPKNSVLSMYNYYLRLLSAQRLIIMPGETPLQYSGRIDSYFIFTMVRKIRIKTDCWSRIDSYFTFTTYSFKAVTDIFVKARYSLNEIDNEEKKFVYRFYKVLDHKTKNNLGKFMYFVYKYILGRF